MIKKLKHKFILINMSLVSLVLLLVFGVILIFSKHQFQLESDMTLARAIDRPFGVVMPNIDFGGMQPDFRIREFPVVTVLLDRNLEIKGVDAQSVTISDDVLQEITKEILASKKSQGILNSYQLRFKIKSTFEGVKIALLATNFEKSQLLNLLTALLLAGLGALMAFAIISFFLAKWVLRPVEKAWDQQKRFVADASHELRTPLTVILANMSILKKHPEALVADQSKWIDFTQTEAERMKGLVDDLLFLAKYDQNHVQQIQNQVNLSDHLWRAILPYESVAYEMGVSIETEIADLITVKGNEIQLQQLMMILLENACKYAGQGGKVTVNLKKNQSEAVLSIHNTGQAIPAENLPHIFDRFYRVASSRQRDADQEHGGYGLGLSIASAITQAHHGHLSATSAEAQGTTFTLKLPLTLGMPKDTFQLL